MPYNPQNDAIVIAKPLGALGFPIDSRSLYYDKVNLIRRAYLSTSEVIAEFDTPLKRKGKFIVYVNNGGILQPDGSILGGVDVIYWWKSGTADSDLVVFAEKGDKGDKGDTGEPFNPDAIGIIGARGNYNNEPEGFSYLSTDENPPMIYWRTGAVGIWSNGIPFATFIQYPYTLKVLSNPIPNGKDGIIAFENRGKFYLVGGWNNGNTPKTDNEQFVSIDKGITWTKIANAPFTGRHTVATASASGKTYIVGGDLYNLEYDGALSKQSWSFDNGAWTKIAEDCGIGNRILSALVYHEGAFYLIGGQVSTVPADGLYTSVLKSTDNCLSFSQITNSAPFTGNLWGAVVSFKGKMWKVCGGVYSDTLSQRTYPKEIYSSVDGINWILEGTFPGVGRSYAQLSVVNNTMILSHGYNHLEGGNLNDMWISENGVTWSKANLDDITRHAQSAWVYDNILYWAAGTTNSATAPIVGDVVSLTKQSNIQNYIDNETKQSTRPLPNTVVKRDDRGYIEGVYLKSANQSTVNTAPISITGKSGDDYLYQFTQEAARLFLGYSDLAISANYNDVVDKPNIDRILQTGNTTERKQTVGILGLGLGGYYDSGKTQMWFDNEYGLQIMPGDQIEILDGGGSPIALPTRLFNFQFLRPDGGVLFENKAGTNRTDFVQLGVINLNTAPASATATGAKGEIRITADYIYVCIATNTWVRSALTTW